jgi:hypothetical protein
MIDGAQGLRPVAHLPGKAPGKLNLAVQLVGGCALHPTDELAERHTRSQPRHDVHVVGGAASRQQLAAKLARLAADDVEDALVERWRQRRLPPRSRPHGMYEQERRRPLRHAGFSSPRRKNCDRATSSEPSSASCVRRPCVERCQLVSRVVRRRTAGGLSCIVQPPGLLPTGFQPVGAHSALQQGESGPQQDGLTHQGSKRWVAIAPRSQRAGTPAGRTGSPPTPNGNICYKTDSHPPPPELDRGMANPEQRRSGRKRTRRTQTSSSSEAASRA